MASLLPLTLPAAPPVVRGTAAPVRRRRLPALALLVLGALLVVGPIAGGLFVKVASGQQMIDAFTPHMTPDALDRYDGDLATLRSGAATIEQVYRERSVPASAYPGVEAYRVAAPAIDERATTLLKRIRGAEPDYRKVADIGGFDRVPFLLIVAGLVLAYAGAVLLRGSRSRAGGAVLLALAAGIALAGYPLLSDLPTGTRAGQRLQAALAPVMTHQTVRAEQDDFVVLVAAIGQLDTAFREQPRTAQQSRSLDAVVTAWPAVSSDLASLIGAINDNIANDQAFADLDDATSGLGFSGLAAMPWALVGVGVISVLAAAAAYPRPRKDLR